MTAVVIPWRDDGHRAVACRLVCATYRVLLPGSTVLLVDSGHEPFNRAASRNRGVDCLSGDEVVVVADADTLPDGDALHAAIAAAKNGGLHYPFVTCHYLSQVGTERVIAGGSLSVDLTEFSIPLAQGGVMVMLVNAWRQAGGMDEGFIGWGYEDNAWYRTVAQRYGEPTRHAGDLWHLWHPARRYSGSSDEQANLARVWVNR